MPRHDTEFRSSVTLNFCAQKDLTFGPLLKDLEKNRIVDTVKVS